MPPSSEVTLLDSTEHLAFISYSSRDLRSAISLHRALERTSYPDSPWWRPKKLRPIFRDRDDLKAGSDLTSLIKNALKQSKCLVVVCSQNTSMSDWVNAEISYFCSLNRQNRVFLFVVGPPETETSKLIPASLQSMPVPLFADSRATGDGWRKAVAKIAAGIIDVPLDSILQRYKQESARRTAWRTGGAVLVLLLCITAYAQYSLSTSRRLAHKAESLTASQIDLALLLGVEAYRVFPTEEAQSALRSILNSVQYLSGILYLDGNATKVVYSPKGDFLVSGDSKGSVTFRTAKKPWSIIRSVRAHGAPVSYLLFDREGNRLISADEDGNIILWAHPFETSRKLSIRMTHGTCCLSLHPAGTMLAVSRELKIEIWDIDKGKTISGQIELWTDRSLSNSPDDDITVLAFGRIVGNYFAAGGERSAQILTTGDWKFYRSLQVPEGWINLDEPPTLEAVDFSKTGILAGGWSNGRVFFLGFADI